jgi:hypothetical protein
MYIYIFTYSYSCIYLIHHMYILRPPAEAGGDLLEIIADLDIRDEKIVKIARQILDLKAYKFSKIGLYAENRLQIGEGRCVWDMRNVAYAALVCVSIFIHLHIYIYMYLYVYTCTHTLYTYTNSYVCYIHQNMHIHICNSFVEILPL